MADIKKVEMAVKTYRTLCEAFDNHNWKYERNDRNLSIKCSAQGDDLPMDVVITVDIERMVVQLLSKLPFTASESKRLDFAVAVCAINSHLVDGCFDYDVTSGDIYFRMTNSYRETNLDEEVFAYMLLCSCGTIDEYNDKLLMFSKGLLSIANFINED